MLERVSLLPIIVVAAAVSWSGSAVAQQSAPPASAEAAAEQPTAPVIIDGVTLFNVRGVTAYAPDSRAAAIAGRIRAIASDRGIPVDSLVVRDSTPISRLLAAGRPVMTLLDADAQLEGVSRTLLAEVFRSRVADAIQRYRRDREAAMLWRSVALALAATLGLGLVLWMGLRMLRIARAGLDRWCQSHIKNIRVRHIDILRAEQIWRGLQRLLRYGAILAALLGGYVYLNYVLRLFPWTRGLGYGLSGMLLGPLGTLATGAARMVPNLVFLFILALLTRGVLRVVRLFFQRLSDGTLTWPGFEREWAHATDRIVRVAVIAFALVIAYPYIPGSGSEAFKGITILMGLIFSLGSPSVIGNLVAGQSLAFRRAFRAGDLVKIGDNLGEVVQIRLLTTYLRSPKNEEIVIPNSLILNSEVVNFSARAGSSGIILHTTVGIGYETSWRLVESMLLEAAARTPGLLPEPAPFVLQKSLGNFAVEYEINVYCNAPLTIPRLYSALHRSILDVFNENEVQIMTPAYEGDPEQAKVVPPDRWFDPLATPPSRAGPDDAPLQGRFLGSKARPSRT